MFLALGLSSIAAVGVVVRSVAHAQRPLASWTWTAIYWLMVAHVFFALSFWLKPAVYAGRLSSLARFFKAKMAIGILVLFYVGGFLYAFLSPRTS